MQAKILLVDDDESIRGLLKARLETLGYDVAEGECLADLWEHLRTSEFHALLLDFQLPDGNGIESIPQVQELEPNLPVIIITAHGSVEHAVNAMRNGAYDFSPKPIDFSRFEVSVKNALGHFQLKNRISTLEKSRRATFCGMIGGSAEMQVVYNTIATVAPSNASVLITGESGTGKELAAAAIHQLSPRNEKEMVEVNCAAIPNDLLESELFGHEKAAFTGAAERKIGKCEQADGSTLFLDEIGEMEIGLQAKMLRFLQDHILYRVGGKQKIHVDIRVVSATNRDPRQAIQDGALREDLFYRLNVVNIELPPLRDRAEDILPLAEYFLEKFAKENNKRFGAIDPAAEQILLAHRWPGNIRELENCLQQSAVLNDGKTLGVDMLPVAVRNGANAPHAEITKPMQADSRKDGVPGEIVPIDVLERQAIENALRVTKGNVTKTSVGLNISQATLYRKIREYQLNVKRFKQPS